MSKRKEQAAVATIVETPAESNAITSGKLAAWEDGIKDSFGKLIAALVNNDGSPTAPAFAFQNASRILLRVGALVNKTLSGAVPQGQAESVVEPFQIILPHEGNGLLHVILNFRNAPADMARMALAGLVAAVCYERAYTEAADKTKAKRWTNKSFNEVTALLGITRTPIKDAADRTTGHEWAFNGPSADLLKQASAAAGPFPADALAMFKKVGEKGRTATFALESEGKTYNLTMSGDAEGYVGLYNVLTKAGLVVTHIQFLRESLAREVAGIIGDGIEHLVHVKGIQGPILDAPAVETKEETEETLAAAVGQ